MSMLATVFAKSVRARKSALVAVALLVGARAGATSVHGPADLETLTRAADAVVRARVVGVESRSAGESSGLIVTFVELALSEQWKGEPVGARFSVRLPGGAAGGLAQEVAGTGSFRVGEEVVVFLRLRARASARHLAIYELSHWALGKFSLGRADAAAEAQAMRERSGLDCVGCGPSEEDVLPLEALRARVLAELARASQARP